jgi:hypothetical protein
MKIPLLIALLTPVSVYADQSIKIGLCRGQYALCAASSTEPTGNTVMVNGIAFPEGRRIFTTTAEAGMSNMWSYPCTVRPKKINGATLADCTGRTMNESPWTGTAIPVGTKVGTAAPVGAANPVGGNFP